MKGTKNSLGSIKNIRRVYGFDFAKNTTYGCGGRAEVAYFPASIRKSVALYRYLNSCGIPFVVLGNGSNVLASDSPFKGAVVCTKALSGIYQTGEDRLFCRAGTTVSRLLSYCTLRGFGGLEFLAGIPATVGGLVCMNGGAGGSFIGDKTCKVKICDGKVRDLTNKMCDFGHKHSTMRDINCLILGAELCVKRSEPDKVRERVQTFLSLRAAQPKGRSCGCVFKNPDGRSAGQLIDRAGLKGAAQGGAYVSEEHANFILNRGKRAEDVYRLIQTVKERVYSFCGVALEEELVYIGDFDEFNR